MTELLEAPPDVRALRTRVLRSVAEVEAEREALSAVEWRRIDADPEFFLAIVAARREVVRPHVVLVEDGERIVGAFVGRIEDVRHELRFGYAVLARPRLRALTLVHGGLVGGDDGPVARALLLAVETALADGDADVVVLPSLAVGTAFDAALAEVAWHRRLRGGDVPHRRLVLPESFEALLASWTRKTRYNVRRQSDILERALEPDLSFRVLREPGDADRVMADLEHVAARTYQRALGAGFADTPEFRRIVPLALERGWLRAYVLYHRRVPIAFWHAYAYGNTLHVSTTGYDAAYSEYSPGTHVQMLMFQDACADPALRVVDFGLGDAQYKQRFGNESWSEHAVTAFAPRLRPLTVATAQRLTGAVGRAAARALRSTGLMNVVKRRWRGRLRGGPS